MPDPISYTSAAARYGLPFLFAGQAQKEFTVNEAHARIDALLHPAVHGEIGDPPPAPQDGECWQVSADASGAWVDRAGQLACREAGAWAFVSPLDGMRVFDRSAGQDIRYAAGWQRAEAPVAPTGGATVDAEARAAIGGLIQALIAGGGLLPTD